MASVNPEVRYCYRCGKRLGAQHDKCWYCGASTLRQIRPPRQCPFCMQELPHKAVKCHHCGEFVDGRPTSAHAAGGQQTVNFVIDKAVFHGDQSMSLEGGMEPSGPVSVHLSSQTREAIRQGRPELIDQDGVQALPAPSSGSDEPSFALQRGSNAPVRAVESSDIVEAEIVGGGEMQEAEPRQQDEEASKYVNCGVCGTEMLTDDNYCFHCGTLQKAVGTTEASHRKLKKLARASATSNTAYHVLTILFGLVIAFAGLTSFQFTYLQWEITTPRIIGGLAVISLLLIVSAFLRRRILSAQIWTALVAIFWLACLAVGLFGRDFLNL